MAQHSGALSIADTESTSSYTGHVDAVFREGRSLRITGWAHGVPDGGCRYAGVRHGKELLPIITAAFRLPSSDVAAFAEKKGADLCRFVIRCAGPRTAYPSRTTIEVIPHYPDGPGPVITYKGKIKPPGILAACRESARRWFHLRRGAAVRIQDKEVGDAIREVHPLSLGNIDRIECQGDDVKVFGWAAARDFGTLRSVAVSCGGERVNELRFDGPLSSVDVWTAHPSLPFARQCRFAASFRKPTNKLSTIEITPQFEGGDGETLYSALMNNDFRPPSDLVTGIGGGWEGVAWRITGNAVHLCGLTPRSNVLDAGCGSGRLAVAMRAFLKTGSYDGFDIHESSISWATKALTLDAPKIRFQHLNVRNDWYNPRGAINPDTVSFPYPDRTFDCIFMCSLLTHLPASQTRRYLSEAFRVLRPGGFLYATSYLLNAQTDELIILQQARHDFRHYRDGYYYADEQNPEGAIAFSEQDFDRWIAASGFILHRRCYGSWRGVHGVRDYQDTNILNRPLT